MRKWLCALLCLCVMVSASLLARCEEEEASPAGYVLLTIGEESTWIPLPAPGEEEFTITLSQQTAEGEEWINLLTLTPESVRVTEANCHGQDCVSQGEVTLENREFRLMQNLIVCLPHRLTIALYSAEEYERLIAEEESHAAETV